MIPTPPFSHNLKALGAKFKSASNRDAPCMIYITYNKLVKNVAVHVRATYKSVQLINYTNCFYVRENVIESTNPISFKLFTLVFNCLSSDSYRPFRYRNLLPPNRSTSDRARSLQLRRDVSFPYVLPPISDKTPSINLQEVNVRFVQLRVRR